MTGRAGRSFGPMPALLVAAGVVLAACAMPPVPAAAPTLSPTEGAPPRATSPANGPPATASPTIAPQAPAVVDTLALGEPAGLGRAPEDLLALGGRVYVACAATANVCRLEGGALVGCLEAGGRISALAGDPATGRLYALDETAGEIRVLEGERVVEIWPAPGARSLAHTGGRLWLGDREGGLDALTPGGTVALSAALGVNSGVLAIAPSPDGGRLYAATYGRLHAVDAASGDVLGSAAVNGLYRALGISPDGETVYVTACDAAEGQAHIVALAAQTLAAQTLPAQALSARGRALVPADPAEMVVDPATGRVFVLSSSSGEVTVFDAALAPLASLSVGLDPRHLTIDPAARRVYASATESDNVYAIDADALAVVAVVPLAGRYVALAADPASSRTYVAAASADRLLVVEPGGAVHAWPLGAYPFAVLPLPEEGFVAALTRNPPRLRLLSPEDGSILAEHPIAPRSGGLHYDAAARTLYAGSVRLDLASGRIDEVVAHSPRGAREAPEGYFLDTRRERLFAIAFNGIPGSNGGTVLAPVDPQAGPAPATPVGITAAVYDEATDRLFSAFRRMGQCGLHVSRAEDGAEILGPQLEGCPEHLALVGSTGHLWVAVNTRPAAPAETLGGEALVIALDATTLGRVATIPIDGRVDSLAVDAARGRVLVADGETGRVVAIQDVAMPAPPPPSPTPTWTPYPIAPPAP